MTVECPYSGVGGSPPTSPTTRPRTSDVRPAGRRVWCRDDPQESSAPGRGRVAFLRRCHRVAQLARADPGPAARTGRTGRLLDLYLHQLAAHGPLPPGVVGQVPGPGADGGRGAHARVRG